MTNSFNARGKAMNRGGLTVLKRLLLTALGVLGVCAVSAGPAFAQQIPAPGFYLDSLRCKNGVIPEGGTKAAGQANNPASAFKAKEGAMSVFDKATGGVAGAEIDATVGGGYSQIDAGGTDALTPDIDFKDMLNGRTTPCTVGDDPVGVAGYAEAERLEGRADSRAPDPGDDPSDSYLEAKAKRDALNGPVYKALYEEVAAQRKVDAEIEAWNALFVDDDDDPDDDGEYRKALSDYRAIAINDLQAEDEALTGTGAEQTAARVKAYDDEVTDAQGFRRILNRDEVPDDLDAATEAGTLLGADVDVDAVVATMFDDDGKLRLATTATGPAANRVNRGGDAVSTLYTDLGKIADALSALDTTISAKNERIGELEGRGFSATSEKDELKRLEVVKEHFDDELIRLRRVASNSYTATQAAEANSETSEDKIRAYNNAVRSVEDAREDLKSAVEDLESKRKIVFDSFTDTGKYLESLQSFREWEFNEADEDDQEDEDSDVFKNRKTARAQLEAYQGLDSDSENPTAELVKSLLVADGKAGDDDGQALVEAISANHDAIQKVADRVPDEMDTTGITENKKAIEALTADADDEGVEMDGLVTANTKNIATNTKSIANISTDLYGTTASQHGDTAACGEGATGLLDRAACNEAGILHNADDIKDNAAEIDDLDGRVTANEETLVDHGEKLMQKKMYIDNLAEEIGVDPVTGMGTEANGMSRIDNNETRSMDNATAIAANDMDIAANVTAIGENKTAIESNDMDIADNVTAIGENKTAIESNDMDIAANVTAIGENKTAIESNDMDIAANVTAIADEAKTRGEMDMVLATAIDTERSDRMDADTAEAEARMGADMMLATAIDEEVMDRASADMGLSGRIDTNAGNISTNADAIAANMRSIGSNASAIGDNRNMIGELSDDLDVVRAGVAASMALAGMPAINGRGISIGVGSFDGESAFAVGFQIQGEQASFKVGVTSSGGATGASAGVGFNF